MTAFPFRDKSFGVDIGVDVSIGPLFRFTEPTVWLNEKTKGMVKSN